jgi:hypothetical protein
MEEGEWKREEWRNGQWRINNVKRGTEHGEMVKRHRKLNCYSPNYRFPKVSFSKIFFKDKNSRKPADPCP